MTTALLLAAGESRRTSPTLKQLYPIKNKPLVQFMIDKLREGGLKRVIVVLGYEAESIKIHIDEKKADVIINENYANGMLTSIKRGLMGGDDHLIMPVDHPAVRVETIKSVLGLKDRITIPVYRGKRGHPVLIPGKFIEELRDFDGKTLRDFIHNKDFSEICVGDPGVILNFNTMEDFANYFRTRKHIPKS